MKVINAKVPRNLIKKFCPHPEVYGDFIVVLINDMYTDVYYCEEGDFFTPTNDKKLVKYLKKNKMGPRKYFYRNDVFAFRYQSKYDFELLESWKEVFPIVLELDIKNSHVIPPLFMFCYKWAEIGIVTIIEKKLTLNIYEKALIKNLDLEHVFNILKNYITQKDFR